MSRIGGDDELPEGLYFGELRKSIDGERGQEFMKELLSVLDGMTEKKLSSGFFTGGNGEFCTLGAIGIKRGIKMDDLMGYCYCDTELTARRFNIPETMALEIMSRNDMQSTKEQRFINMRNWVAENIKKDASNEKN